MEVIHKYFPHLNDLQIQRFSQLWELYQEWNQKINVISRKDIDNLYIHHILHSLAIAKYIEFKAGSKIMDLGTGGGFPGIPLAIMFPEVHFTLIDGTRKKIAVCQEIIQALELSNATAIQKRAEEHKAKYDFVVTRAVATMDKLQAWTNRLIGPKQKNAIPNGLIALKGGKIKQELTLLAKNEYTEVISIKDYFAEPFFADKYVVYLQG